MIDLLLDERAQCKGKSLLRTGGMQGGEEKKKKKKRKGGMTWRVWDPPMRAHPHQPEQILDWASYR